MASGPGERTSPPPTGTSPEERAGARAHRASVRLPSPVPEMLRDALIARLRALGNQTRFRVWDELRQGQATVSELTERVPFSQQSVSSALLELHDVGLVEREHVGNRVCYRLSDRTMEHALAVQELSIHRRAARFARELQDAHRHSLHG